MAIYGAGNFSNPKGQLVSHVAPLGNDFSVGGFGGKSGALGKNDVIGQQLDRSNPYLQQDRKNKDAADKAAVAREGLYGKTQGINTDLETADTQYASDYQKQKDQYLDTMKGSANAYQNKLNILSNQASDQATNAKSVYDSTILPRQKNDVDNAMSLKDYGDPNNAIQKSVRELYNQQGQHVRQQGQQDFGVLSALGAQAAQGQFGAAGAPQTAGMMGQIYGQNQAQAGNAYAAAQQRMYDLQQQGINKGFEQNDKVYGAGIDAQNRYENSQNNMLNQQAQFRGEIGGYAGENFGINSELASDTFDKNQQGSDIYHNNAYAQGGRKLGMYNQYYGGQQQDIANNLAAAGANNAAKGQLIGSVVGAGATAYGANRGAG